MKVRISDDAIAIACGADDVAAAFAKAGVEVERVSSWGMQDRKSTRLNSSHRNTSRMPSSA